MNIIPAIFSPTGGTEKVASILANALGQPVPAIDMTDPHRDFHSVQIDAESLAVIAIPVFGGRVPALNAERLRQINGGGAKCVIVGVYGNRAYDNALAELKHLAEGCGFTVIAAVAAIAEHSILRQYATGRPDHQDEEDLRGFASQILEKLSTGAPVQRVPGTVPDKQPGGSSMVPKSGKACVACGLCADKCPAQAINKENVKTADSKKCIACMRCVAVCPKGARQVNSAVKTTAALALKKACSERKGNELFL